MFGPVVKEGMIASRINKADTAPTILALDIGQARVGVAIGDHLTNMAVPIGTFDRQSGVAEREILQLITQRSIGLLVIGLPLSESGERTPQCEDVERFARRLARRAPVELRFIDEYLSSQEAGDRLASRPSGGRASQGRQARRKNGHTSPQKGLVDALAATILLEAHLKGE